MKKLWMFLFILTIALVATAAQAADEKLTIVADEVVVALDRNGQEYVRVIASFDRSIEGTSYKRALPVMFFGTELVSEAKLIETGQTLNVVASKRMYQGRESYTAHAIMK